MSLILLFPVDAAFSSSLAMRLFARPAWLSVPFFLARAIKMVYDLLLWKQFSSVRPPAEQKQ
jgi:hypothetical protein